MTVCGCVLFDAHGTLIELAEPVGEIYSRVAARHGVELPAWRLDDAFRRVLRHAPPRVPTGAAIPEIPELERAWWRTLVHQTFQATDSTVRFADFEGFFSDLFATFARGECWHARPGAVELLDALRARGLALGIVSNFDHRLMKLLEALGIRARVDTVQIPAICGAAKPSAAPFEAALAALGASADAALYVGDDAEADLRAARALGLRTLAVAGLEHLQDVVGMLDDADEQRGRCPET